VRARCWPGASARREKSCSPAARNWKNKRERTLLRPLFFCRNVRFLCLFRPLVVNYAYYSFYLRIKLQTFYDISFLYHVYFTSFNRFLSFKRKPETIWWLRALFYDISDVYRNGL
jgi:hypothetical protein